MPLTSDQKRTVAKLVPAVFRDFTPGAAVGPTFPRIERALAAAVERGRVVVSLEGPIRSVEYFTLGNVEGVRVFGQTFDGAALVKYYRFLAS